MGRKKLLNQQSQQPHQIHKTHREKAGDQNKNEEGRTSRD